MTVSPISPRSTTPLPTTVGPLASQNALLIKLGATPDFSKAETMPRGPERKLAAYEAIVQNARTSQAPAIAVAEKLKAEGSILGYETLELANMLIVTPTPSNKQLYVSAAFQALDGVKAIYSNQSGLQSWPRTSGTGIAPDGPTRGLDVIDEPATLVAPPADRPYGIDMIGAPAAWEQGADGRGLVYGSIDTGADVTHEAIADRYRGRNADGSVTHDYNWYDPLGSTAPKDANGHGTHTIGTVTGAGVGVAPGARFISAAGLSGNVDSTLRSLQWMLAPTKVDGSAPDPTKGADVVGMSWWTGSPKEELFLESMQGLRAAGIEPVKSAGNQGPGATTITSPGHLPQLVAAAAVDSKGDVARFSSRGPVNYPKGETSPKPDFAAPGVDVVSSLPGNKYGKLSGTSMAQPHLSGAVLALLSKYPQLSHSALVLALRAGAIDKGAPGRDADYGMGLINLPASLAAAEQLLARTVRVA